MKAKRGRRWRWRWLATGRHAGYGNLPICLFPRSRCTLCYSSEHQTASLTIEDCGVHWTVSSSIVSSTPTSTAPTRHPEQCEAYQGSTTLDAKEWAIPTDRICNRSHHPYPPAHVAHRFRTDGSLCSALPQEGRARLAVPVTSTLVSLWTFLQGQVRFGTAQHVSRLRSCAQQ